MKKTLFMDINVGIGDHLFLRVFVDGVKDQYDHIYVTHSKAGMQFWHHNDAARWDFNLKLGKLLFSEPPYTFVPNLPNVHYPFFPNERIVKEINNKPIKPNINQLCVGTTLGIDKYIVLTTKVREFPKIDFDQLKDKLTPALQALAKNYKIVILGEKEVQRTIEYEAECNRQRVFGIYDYLISILPADKIVDLTIPALGIICSTLPQLQQDCLIMREAAAVITFGMGGNFWISNCVANKTIGLRADNELERLSITSGYPDTFLTKDINQFVDFLGKI
jgi:hypothetical protein